MLGEIVVVAPIVTKGATKRDIYIPRGTWQDGNNKNGKKINGPKWIRNYTANLDTLPYFIKVQSSFALSSAVSGFTSNSIVWTSTFGLILLNFLIRHF